jgi:hypothetical protein
MGFLMKTKVLGSTFFTCSKKQAKLKVSYILALCFQAAEERHHQDPVSLLWKATPFTGNRGLL